jgi:hypothetical protein
MRALGAAERALALMVARAKSRRAFGAPLAEQGSSCSRWRSRGPWHVVDDGHLFLAENLDQGAAGSATPCRSSTVLG